MIHKTTAKKQHQPQMLVIANRPIKVARLDTMDGIYVQCRLETGEDVHVPLRDIFALFEQALSPKVGN